MALTKEIQTIQDMENLHYRGAIQRYVNPLDASSGFPLAKTSGTLVTTTGTGYYRAVLGAEAWIQVNMEANVFGALGKIPWGRTGMRLLHTRSAALPTAGIAQDGALPSATYPDVIIAEPGVKTAAVTWAISEVHQTLAAGGHDDSYFDMAEARRYFVIEHKEDLNEMLCEDYNTLASNAFESVDRVTASSVERAACGENDGDEDLHGIDRSTYTWFNAQVSHLSNVDRYLTEAILQTQWRTLGAAGANTTFNVTGWDTWGSWNELYDPKVRHELLAESLIRPGVNGIETVEPGIQAGTALATWMRRPVIITKDAVQDTLSRIYMLDTSNPLGHAFPRLSIGILLPTNYFESGVGVDRPIEQGKLNLQGLYRTSGELRCPFPAAQGKIRDLK